MKKIRINKLKLKNNVKYALILSILLVAVVFFPSTLSKFQSNGSGDAKIDLAFSLLETDELVETISLTEILPDGKQYEYTFSVSNYNEEKRIDVNIQYDITIRTTTNLPIEYEIYDSEGNKINTDFEIIKDEDGTYFNVLKTDKRIVTYEEDSIEMYTLKYSLDSVYNDSSYQDIIELITVEINAEQVM